jgi:peptidoglycan LD-endopeptidase CwlK
MTSPRRRTSKILLIISALMIAIANQLPAGASEDSAQFKRLEGDRVVARLVIAYPDLVTATPAKADGKPDAVTVRGTTALLVDQQRQPKDFEERLDQADLIDQLSIPYPAGCPAKTPTVNEDPGRLRFDPFFSAMYGGSAKAVAKNLTTVKWFGQNVQVTKVNGVDNALQAVATDLASLIKAKPDLRKYVAPSAGTYNFRTIAGTKRLSMHAYGVAIDLNTAYSDYWRWDGVGTPPKYRNRIPCEIGQVFEQHGFIWGAKWYHYDTMHFEYRPELLP